MPPWKKQAILALCSDISFMKCYFDTETNTNQWEIIEAIRVHTSESSPKKCISIPFSHVYEGRILSQVCI